MKVIVGSVVLLVGAFVNAVNFCPSLPSGERGGQIYDCGISKKGISDIVNAHNKYRLMVMNGTVPDQSKGKRLKMMSFDTPLANAARNVSKTCKMVHVIAKDGRWPWVGQNLFITWSTVYTIDQDWAGAAAAWYNEYPNFKYPNITKNNTQTGHYTQLVWANSEKLGCDCILFNDKSQPKYPYAKLYSCNYGPGGNIVGQAPYPLA